MSQIFRENKEKITMPKPFLTESHIAFIKANRFKMSASKMAIKFGCSSSVVQRYMRENGLKVPKNVIHKFRSEAHIGKTSFTPKQDVFIRENYLNIPVKTMGAMIGKSGTGIRTRLRQLGLKIPKQIVEKRKLESRFSSGHKTFNKGKKQKEWMTPEKIERSKATRFKKGNIPERIAGLKMHYWVLVLFGIFLPIAMFYLGDSRTFIYFQF